ncbi:insulin-induced gene 2 protein [Hyperolius riggenbachi]|uniref:insulin-induced gene 2 protein n=1 Tax=Hyperolius riggenbachi TaxID=752182 RepID=UPI0035A2BD21
MRLSLQRRFPRRTGSDARSGRAACSKMAERAESGQSEARDAPRGNTSGKREKNRRAAREFYLPTLPGCRPVMGDRDETPGRPTRHSPGCLHKMNLPIRGLLLFLIGVFLALVLNLLQVQRNVTLFPPDVLSSLFSSAWWVPLCCGTAAAAIGLLYPCIDRQLGEPHRFKREWSSVMRCVAVFVGINHASAKVDFANNMQLSLTLAALSIGLWWTFDRSRSGLGLGIGIAFFATLVSQLLVYNGVYQYTSPDFLYVRSWLPCIFFAGGITMGNIGRQLEMYERRSHQD